MVLPLFKNTTKNISGHDFHQGLDYILSASQFAKRQFTFSRWTAHHKCPDVGN